LCKNCEFYEEIDEDNFCYRYPPRIVNIKGQLQTEYPTIDPKVDWCGEFQPRDATEVIEAEAIDG
jgi:hypothetical protein